MKRPWIIPASILCLAIGFWEVASRLSGLPGFILPPPSRILQIAVGQAPKLLPHVGITLLEILAGIALALIVAVPLSVAMFAKPALEKALAPFLVASQAIPVFALAPLLVFWLGYGLASKILMAAVIIFFPITVSLLEGFRSCEASYRVLFRLMGAGFRQTLRRLYWPWALPYFFAGLRVGASVATIGAVIGEWVGGPAGTRLSDDSVQRPPENRLGFCRHFVAFVDRSHVMVRGWVVGTPLPGLEKPFQPNHSKRSCSMKRLLSILILIVAIGGAGPAHAGEPVTIMLDWFPNVDHMPIYVAQQRGFFKDEGLSVKILSPSDTADALKLAAAGKVDLAVSYEPQTLMAVAGGIDVRVVGRLIGHPLTTLMFLDKSDIATPKDLSGRTIGYTVPGLMDVLMNAFAKVNGITDYELINVGFSIAPALVKGRVDAVMGPFKTYESVTLAAEGIDSRYFELEKWSIPDYDELIFICGPKTLEEKKEQLKGFVKALSQGIGVIKASPDQALSDYFAALPDADRDVETAAFKLTRPYYAASQTCDRGAWQAFADFALKHGLIEHPVDVAQLLTGLAD